MVVSFNGIVHHFIDGLCRPDFYDDYLIVADDCFKDLENWFINLQLNCKKLPFYFIIEVFNCNIWLPCFIILPRSFNFVERCVMKKETCFGIT